MTKEALGLQPMRKLVQPHGPILKKAAECLCCSYRYISEKLDVAYEMAKRKAPSVWVHRELRMGRRHDETLENVMPCGEGG